MDFVFVADAIPVGVCEAVPVAVESGFGIGAGPVVTGGCRIVVAGVFIRTTVRSSDEEGVSELVAPIAFNEELNVKLAADFTCGGELSHEHFEIVSRNSIGVAVQGIPSATNGVVDRDVASR